MALQTALTNDQLTDIRSGAYQALQFVCTVPNTVVVRFQPSAAPASDVFAEITVGSVGTGSMSNIAEGQLVIFSTSTDHQATEFFRTRVRKVSGTTTLYVGENSQALTTSHYVTVLNTYEIQERLRRDETRVDWDITFRKLRPVETALQSAYVLSNGTTAFTPTASPRVMDADAASISTHAWSSSNSNDTLNSGGTTASPNFTLQAGAFRWIRYTFTDNLGLSNYRVIPVWTVPKNYSSVVQLGFGSSSGELASISFDPELGWTCSIPAFDGIETLLNRTLTVIASDEWYGGVTNSDRQSIRTNINFIGYLQNESVQTNADEQHGQISETQFTIESFGHQLARQNISPVTVIQTASSAAAWDEIKNPTPGRMLTYRLTEYSTASTLMAIKLPSDDTDFIGDDLTLSTEKALDDLIFIGDVINAEIQFDVTGKLELCRDLNYLGTTARDAAPVVATLTPDDFASQYTIDYEYGKTTSQATITGGSYQTLTDTYTLFEAITPAEARYTEGDPFELSNQVLTTDNTSSENIIEIGQRVANFLAANNPTWTLRVTLKDQWHFLIPDVGAWFKFTIAATDTVRGKVFGASDRWQLVQIDVSTNSETGTREVGATFRHETSSTGASVRATPIVNDPEADIVNVPAAFPALTGGNLDFTGGYYYDTQDSQPPSEPNPVSGDCENGGFRVKDVSGYTTAISAGNGELIEVGIRGHGIIQQAGNSALDQEFSDGMGDWVFRLSGATEIGQLTGGRIEGVVIGNIKNINILLNLGSPIDVDSVRIVGERVGGLNSSGDARRIECRTTPNVTGGVILTGGGADNGAFDITADPSSLVTGVQQILVAVSVDDNPSSDIYLDRVVVTTADGVTIEVLGDAFYYSEDNGETWEAYDVGDGLLIEGFQPDSIPPFNPNHEYLVTQEVTSGVITYEFNSPYDLDDAENFSFQIQTCLTGVFP